jgi:hypothetical protein
MQNKANFRKSQMNVNKVLTKDYEKKTLGERGKKQSQTKPNKANFKKAKMNVTVSYTNNYENKTPIRAPKKQSQISKRQKPMQTSLPKRIMKKTALSAPGKTNPIKANLLNAQMNVNKVLTKDYEIMSNWAICENKPNQTQFQTKKPSLQVKLLGTQICGGHRILEILLTFTLLPCPAGSAVRLVICAVPQDSLHTPLLLSGRLRFFYPFSLKPLLSSFFFCISPFLYKLLVDNIHIRV